MAIPSVVGSPLIDYPFSGGQFSPYAHCKVKRSDFPENFTFGASTSAYQIEGAWNEGGKGLSIWDFFTMRRQDLIADGSDGCTAIDHYHSYKHDVALMKKMGLKSYRFSIAWTRILPGGSISTGVNGEGIKFYDELIDTLVAAGIEPYVTLFHWDVPQCLEEDYGGFLSEKIVADFCDFAKICFWEFGDRVKYWITLNEPYTFASVGYAIGTLSRSPPYKAATTPKEDAIMHSPIRMHRGAARTHPVLKQGDPAREPYTVAHNLILCHAHAVDIYRRQFQGCQGGKIGMTNNIHWYEPLNEYSQEDRDAASRAFDFMMGWFFEPIVTGDYPESMIRNVGDRLPKFTEKEEKLVKGSYDFLGINYYTAMYASNNPSPPKSDNQVTYDSQINTSYERDGALIGPKAGSDWLHVVPWGIYKLMLRLKQIYNDPVIYITENGYNESDHNWKTCQESLMKDDARINYIQEHLNYLKQAMNHGVKVQGYFIWSLFDNFEWTKGYTIRFGIIYIDYESGSYTRLPKNSAIWFKNFLSEKDEPLLQEKDSEKPDRRKRLKST